MVVPTTQVKEWLIGDKEDNEILRRMAAELESRYPETTPDSTTA